MNAVIISIRYSTKRMHYEFNRPLPNDEYDEIAEFLAYTPVILHGLGALSYTWRWTHYYFLTTSTTPQEHEQAKRFVVANRIAFVIVILVNIGCIILVTFSQDFLEAASIFIVCYYVGIGIALIVIIHMFLRKLRMYIYYVYIRKSKIIRIYAYIISIMIFLRAFSIMLDLIVGQVGDESKHTDKPLFEFNDIQLWAWYFLELTPSLVIIVILLKSNNELRHKLQLNSGWAIEWSFLKTFSYLMPKNISY